MKSKNVKVIDEHNIDRDANVMFALELEGSEYVVYWITRDEESNNLFVSKVLKNIDGTYSMLNIDDEQKKKEVADIVKMLISNSVSDQNDKLVGTTTTLANGKVVKFVNVSFNKEQHIDVAKTYITTVKKEVTKVAENYYDVVVEEARVEAVLPAAPVAVEPVTEIFPEIAPAPVAAQPAPVVVEPITVAQPAVVPTPVVETPVVVTPAQTQETVVVSPVPVVQPTVAPVQSSVVTAPASGTTTVPVVEPVKVEAPAVVLAPVTEASVAPVTTVVAPSVEAPAVILPVPEPATVVEPVVPAPLVFNATKETNLNAALGEVANSTAIPVENIEPIREFGVEAPAVVAPSVEVPAIAPMVQPPVSADPKALTKKAGFANSKFFMVVAVAFFLASCIFLGYEVYNYFQLVK